MQIGIIGSGRIGATVAPLFVRAGHDVAIANSRGPDSLQGLVQELGPQARAVSIAEAAKFGDLVLVAVPFGVVNALPAEELAGKIVIDATNYYPNRDGAVTDLDSGATTSTELVAAHLPDARLVKAFNTMRHTTLAIGGAGDKPFADRLALYLSGDDAQAKAVVSELIELLGFAAIDTGGLATGGRRQQPGSAGYAADLTASQAQQALG